MTIRDVAEAAGVSISTVSNVINGLEKVHPKTRDKVLGVMRKMNFVPQNKSKAQQAARCATIGLFVPSVQGHYYNTLLQVIARECQKAGYPLVIQVCEHCQGEVVHAAISASGAIGAIIMNEALKSPQVERLRMRGLPMVFLDREESGTLSSCVLIDDYEGARQAMDYLLGLGHRRIGFIRGLDHKDGRDRLRAYLDTMAGNRLPVDSGYLLNGEFSVGVAYQSTKDFLARGLELPDAFFAANDESALGCIRALQEAGIRVPGRVSVMGYDDIPQAAIALPPLSTVYNPVEEAGRAAILELLRLMGSHTALQGSRQDIAPRLIPRQSCAGKAPDQPSLSAGE